MLNFLVVFVLPLCLAIGVSGQPNQGADLHQKTAQTEGQTASSLNRCQCSQTDPGTAEGNSPDRYPYIKRPEWWLVIAAFLTLFFLGWQAWETRRAAEISSKTLVAQFRPKLIVRGMALVTPSEGAWQIQYVVANTGDGAAYITESNLTISRIDRVEGKLPTFPPYGPQRDSLGCFTVEPGEHKDQLVDLSQDAITFKLLRGLKERGSDISGNLYCLGFLQYRDRAETKRRTAFCLHYDIQTERFDRVDDPDYEYAD